MKKTILIATLVLLGALGFTVNAQAASCGDVIWGAEILENNPNIGNACREVVEKRGTQAVKLHARIVRQGTNSTIVQWQMPDGSWSASERRYPERGAAAEIGGKTVRISDLAPRQEVNIYVPAAGNWSLPAPAPVAAAAAAAPPPPPPPPPPPAPEPEPEPEPVAMPTTASQVSLFALLGGLFILLGGAVGIARMRM
jgi:hypothetical protein